MSATPQAILGELVERGEFALLPTQRDAWLRQFDILRDALLGLSGTLLLEFNIPRMGRRIDAVVLIGPVVFVIEFKIGEAAFDRAAVDQVWDYALDLKNFHKASHSVAVIPILVASEAKGIRDLELHHDADDVYRPISVDAASLGKAIGVGVERVTGPAVDSHVWQNAQYHPTPTIVEAARSLYANHSVEAIARFDAGATNLRVTSLRIEQLVDQAQAKKQKLICFVTGVPGAGKTLVGLNIATRKRDEDEPTHAVFLSGNGPLVAVLHEALTRDEVVRRQARGERVRKGKIGESVKSFIQNIHHFRDDGLIDPGRPVEHVVIFDEAQRAWNLRKTADFMQRKKKRPGFSQSEPEFLISYMDRHSDWAVIICLVGGGQEINTGEAGIAEWLDAVNKSFPHWHVHISSKLTDSEYAAGEALARISSHPHVHPEPDLHLAASMRSFRSEKVADFVKALLDREVESARHTLGQFIHRFPIAITRDLHLAKQWIRDRARGSERYGLVASSKAQRLKPHAIDIRVSINPVHWFLNDKADTRSSYYLEDAATEFQVQGLELDWSCVTWDGDMRSNGSWSFHDFRGNKWTNIENAENRNYLRNAYRVLLTRARQGMVIFVPAGDANDKTRAPKIYDPTFNYLKNLGLPVLQA